MLLHNMSYDQNPRSYDSRMSSYELVCHMTVVFPSLGIYDGWLCSERWSCRDLTWSPTCTPARPVLTHHCMNPRSCSTLLRAKASRLGEILLRAATCDTDSDGGNPIHPWHYSAHLSMLLSDLISNTSINYILQFHLQREVQPPTA
jgi:hypothetical protein